MILEVCVDSVASAMAAAAGGAQRLELCASLGDGGTTPSAGMVTAVVEAVSIPVWPIVRPRGGGFVYSDAEIAVSLRDIRLFRDTGIGGVVVGPLNADAQPDVAALARLRDAAGDLPLAFHRAFDVCTDQRAALDTLVDLGVVRVLTSGGAPTALEGAQRLCDLAGWSRGRVSIMAGGGIRESTLAAIVRRSGVREIHVRPDRVTTGPNHLSRAGIGFRKALPADEDSWAETDAERVAAMVAAIRSAVSDETEHPAAALHAR